MSKHTGRAAKKQEERAKKRAGIIEKTLSSGQGQIQKFINEWTDKHNKLGQMVDAVFKIATTEIGKIWGNQQNFTESIDHIDLNVLALSELNKKLYRHLHTLMKDAEGKMETEEAAASAADAFYKKDMADAFAIVIARKNKENEEREAKRKAAEAEAKLAAAAKTEAEKAEKALKEAENEMIVDATMSGGRGSEIPEGADVFGG